MIFKDSSGRDWKLKLNYGLILDVKDQTDLDLDALLSNPKVFAEIILANPKKLIELLWVICEEQAKAYDVTPRDFGRMFDRETLDTSTNALIESIVDFYQRSSAGKVIRNKLPEILRKMDDELEKAGKIQVEKLLLNLDTNTAE